MKNLILTCLALTFIMSCNSDKKDVKKSVDADKLLVAIAAEKTADNFIKSLLE